MKKGFSIDFNTLKNPLSLYCTSQSGPEYNNLKLFFGL